MKIESSFLIHTKDDEYTRAALTSIFNREREKSERQVVKSFLHYFGY